jgi:hypothetical protein
MMPIETIEIVPMAASVVRQHVLEQHGWLRQLLRDALESTTRALQGDVDASAQLASVVHDLRGRFRAHLAYEERYLLPVLAEIDVWGPLRASKLLEEHACQRAELETLAEGIEGGWDPQHLAVATRSLVTELLLDMEEEEAGCLSAELLRDDVVNIDQASD